MDFLLVLMELFSLGVTAAALLANIGSKLAISLQRGPVDPKFQVEGVAPTNHCYSPKNKVNILCGIRMRAQLSFVLSQITRLSDRRTGRRRNRIRIARPRLHSMQRGKNLDFFSTSVRGLHQKKVGTQLFLGYLI